MIPFVARKVRSVRSSAFVRDSFFLQIGAGVSMVANLVTSVALFRILGADRTGQFFEAVNLFTLLYFLGNVGISQVVVVRISEALGRGGVGVPEAIGLFVRAHGTYLVVMGVVGAAASPFLGVAFHMGLDVGTWASVLCVSSIASLPFYTVQCVLQGTRRMRLLAEMENLKEITRAFLVLVCAVSLNRPEGAVLGEALSTVFSSVFAWAAYRKAQGEPGAPLPAVRDVLRAAKATGWADVRPVVRTSFFLAIQKNLMALVPTVIPRLMLSYFGNSRDVAFLNLAQNLVRLPLLALQGVSRTIVPLIGKLRGEGQTRVLKKTLTRIMLASGGAVTLASVVWALALTRVIPALYTEAALPAVPLVPWLAASVCIGGFAVGLESFLLVANRLDVAIRSSLVTVAIAFPLGVAAVAHWGGVGAAIYVLLNHATVLFLVAYVAIRFDRLAGTPEPSAGGGALQRPG